MVKKYKILGFTIFFLFLLGVGCSRQYASDGLEPFVYEKQDSILKPVNNNTAPSKKSAPQAEPVQEEKPLFFGPIATIVNDPSYSYFASPISQKIVGQARIKFVNEQTGAPIAGHPARCSSCIDNYSKIIDVDGWKKFEYHYPESNVDGVMIVNLTDEEGWSISYANTDWYSYLPVDIKPGDDIVVKVKPHITPQNQTLKYPRQTYTKNADGSTHIHVTVKDKNGKPVSNHNIEAIGPIKDSVRTSPHVYLSAKGEGLIDPLINGAHRLKLYGTFGEVTGYFDSYYQVDVASGYTVHVEIQAQVENPIKNIVTTSDHLARGMYLVCVLDSTTKKSVSAKVGIPYSNIQFQPSAKYKDYGCTEVPQSYKEVYIPSSSLQSGHSTVSMSGVDKEGVLYVYVSQTTR